MNSPSGAYTYPVHEMFHTFQGEGVHVGKRAFFVRLMGCPVQCPWCDSAGTWHKDFVPKGGGLKLYAQQIANAAFQSGVPRVVVTGGEPCIHNLKELTQACWERGLHTHLETSGSYPISGVWNWITLSPKDLVSEKHIALMEVWKMACEVKLIIDSLEALRFWEDRMEIIRLTTKESIAIQEGNVWLHPEWSQRDNRPVLEAITELVKRNAMFRAGWQLHKLYRADTLDGGSRPPAPLGGDLTKGY